jgi:hypothetical protein
LVIGAGERDDLLLGLVVPLEDRVAYLVDDRLPGAEATLDSVGPARLGELERSHPDPHRLALARRPGLADQQPELVAVVAGRGDERKAAAADGVAERDQR